jgi:amino-acid N-acetyltransferase
MPLRKLLKKEKPTVGFPSLGDLDGILELIDIHVRQGNLLPRSRDCLREDPSSWIVAKLADRVVACASLKKFSQHMAEVRSVAVHPACKGAGLGSAIMTTLTSLARTRGVHAIFAFTRATPFFRKNGFTPVPEKRREEVVAWVPESRKPRAGQDVMVADTRSLDPDAPLPSLAPETYATGSGEAAAAGEAISSPANEPQATGQDDDDTASSLRDPKPAREVKPGKETRPIRDVRPARQAKPVRENRPGWQVRPSCEVEQVWEERQPLCEAKPADSEEEDTKESKSSPSEEESTPDRSAEDGKGQSERGGKRDESDWLFGWGGSGRSQGLRQQGRGSDRLFY